MFTGLVAELGTVRGLKRVQNSYHLTVAARKVLDNLKIGDSVAVNGVCLTVVVLGSGEFTADVMPETVRLSNLRDLRSGDRVNLERTLRLMDGLDGHIVSGHVVVSLSAYCFKAHRVNNLCRLHTARTALNAGKAGKTFINRF